MCIAFAPSQSLKRKLNHCKSGAVCILKKSCLNTYILFLYWVLPWIDPVILAVRHAEATTKILSEVACVGNTDVQSSFKVCKFSGVHVASLRDRPL